VWILLDMTSRNSSHIYLTVYNSNSNMTFCQYKNNYIDLTGIEI
jgi:hypothetical protein